ncbi:hypothetical protein OLMES_4440 [Oleiphilus messinensis]|uniref:Lipoprotein n=1 Tax=Oleiphilus messinensis TaxID=141451 RepID=A0A1Y0IF63_9GAMM|nr:hypothetical protein [Oleiphilus messinensis]ARU58436.1 hypothetical protein OLMES_4440 [Oleiphilus messinensis]
MHKKSTYLTLALSCFFFQGCATHKLEREIEGYTGILILTAIDLRMPHPQFEWYARDRSEEPKKGQFYITPALDGCKEIYLYVRQFSKLNVADGDEQFLEKIWPDGFEYFKQHAEDCGILVGTSHLNKGPKNDEHGPKTTSYAEIVFYTKQGEVHRERTPDLSKPNLKYLLPFAFIYDAVTGPLQLMFPAIYGALMFFDLNRYR